MDIERVTSSSLRMMSITETARKSIEAKLPATESFLTASTDSDIATLAAMLGYGKVASTTKLKFRGFFSGQNTDTSLWQIQLRSATDDGF
ncbi:MAG: hypothetical protein ACOH2B_02160 [Burkholderiaceae bacterium]